MATDPAKYIFNHTMIRIKDPARSLKFYQTLGMKQINRKNQPEASFDLYFLAFDTPQSRYANTHWTGRQAVLELTHNYGTEKDDTFKVSTGNDEPYRGYCHISIAVDAITPACARMAKAGYKLQGAVEGDAKRARAYVLDPDGYQIELVGPAGADESAGATDPSRYKFQHTRFRVKDAQKSVKFYQDTMGMQLMDTQKVPGSSQGAEAAEVYSLAYVDAIGGRVLKDDDAIAEEGFLQLYWVPGTEKDAEFKYHNGNDEPQGFGHICLTMDDLEAACTRFEEQGVKWKKRMADGRMHNIAFIFDPDGYWIEIIQNEHIKDTGTR